jgi:hypothetical protein
MDDRRRTDGGDRGDGATFEPVRLRPGGRAPTLLVGGVLAIALTAAAGVLDRGPEPPVAPITERPLIAQPVGVASAAPRPSHRHSAAVSRSPRTAADLMLLDVRPDGRHLFVHGDVFSLDALVVVVSLEAGGAPLETRRVKLPGGSTSFLTGANPRFDIRFDMPGDAAPGSHWVRASTYDADGVPVASLREPVMGVTIDLPASG